MVGRVGANDRRAGRAALGEVPVRERCAVQVDDVAVEQLTQRNAAVVLLDELLELGAFEAGEALAHVGDDQLEPLASGVVTGQGTIGRQRRVLGVLHHGRPLAESFSERSHEPTAPVAGRRAA